MENKLRKIVDTLAPALAGLSHDLSAHPEVALGEYRTRDVLGKFLHRSGFDIQKGVGGLKTSFVANTGKARHPAIAYIAEMDALPSLGHACGHNVNSAISAGAAGEGDHNCLKPASS